MTWAQLEAKITSEVDRAIKDSIGELQVNIKSEAPVKSGKSRAGYRMVQTPGGWAMMNNVTGANGAQYIPKLWFGWSQQLPQGHWPTVLVWRYDLIQRIENINL